MTPRSKGSGSLTPRIALRIQFLDEHRLRAFCNLVVSNLDRIAEVDDVGNQRPGEALHLLAPVAVSEDRSERRHLGLTLGSVESLVLDEIREGFAFRIAIKKAFDQSSFCLEHFVRIKLDVIVLDRGDIRRRTLCDAGPIDEILHWNQGFVEEDAVQRREIEIAVR